MKLSGYVYKSAVSSKVPVVCVVSPLAIVPSRISSIKANAVLIEACTLAQSGFPLGSPRIVLSVNLGDPNLQNSSLPQYRGFLLD